MDGLMSALTVILILLIIGIIVLAFVYWYMSYKNKKKTTEEENTTQQAASTKIATQYTKKSILKFMEFDKIEDNMIVQDNGQRYLMVIGCEGVNYDLMSEVEKTAVEAGFVQFLNTLRYPIQLYVQTRTVNISESIENYKIKLAETKKELDIKQQEYNRMIKAENYNEKQAQVLKRELLRIKNLYEYGQDVVADIQKTSQNKNVLRKHYYIVVPYNSAELGTDMLDAEEKRSMIFSELYTRAQSLIRTLFACEMKCKILNSNELVELLYIAYNRDESEIYSVEKAIRAGYSELFATAPDVLDKRMKAIDNKIEEDAIQLATETIDEVRLEKERKIEKKQRDFDKLVSQLAETLVKENEKYIGKDVSKQAIERIKNTEEGGSADEQKAKRRTRKISGAK